MTRFRFVFGIVIIISLILPSALCAKSSQSLSPVLNQGQKWRIGYYEGGSYVNYPANLRTLVAGLVELGWMAPINLPVVEDGTASRPVWAYLVEHAKSRYIEFVADGFWSAQWSKKTRTKIKADIIQRLNQKKDVDFMIAMGTWAGQDLSTTEHTTPTMAMSVSDPVRSGMSKTAKDSGIDHFHAKSDPTRYIRQLRLFHRLVNFKRLGFVYENTPEGKTYAAFDDIQTVAKERDIELVSCEAPFSEIDHSASTDRVIECHEKLALKADAVFVTVHRGIDTKRMGELMAPFAAHKTPTWSQRGPNEVRKGILFSISRGGFKAVGRFHAEVMASIFNGRKPRSINQIYEDPKLIAVNTKAAELIGYNIPNGIMRIADEIYEAIEK